MGGGGDSLPTLQNCKNVPRIQRLSNRLTWRLPVSSHPASYDPEPAAPPPSMLVSAQYHIHTHGVFRGLQVSRHTNACMSTRTRLSERHLSPSQDVRHVPGIAHPVVMSSEGAKKRPFVCAHPGCSKKYFKLSHLQMHGRKHTGGTAAHVRLRSRAGFIEVCNVRERAQLC